MERTYRKNEVIFYADEPGGSLFILISGSVKITICDKNGKEDILQIIHPFDFFGEMSLLDGEKRSATVTALEKTITLVIEKSQFLNLLKIYPEISLNMLALLSKRIRRTDEKIKILRFADSYGKIAKVILDIAEENGIREEKNVVNLNLGRQEIANLAGLTRETAIRALNEFKKSGCIKIENKKIIILDKAMLIREIFKNI
ncbi:Crp/Fnr family transcriptional regulator [Candidatus Desantisbacteria bacterium]|nr:Crp/Fnr family transcriptional regulator [Candidatus Desantisbacteria bacterium]